MSERHKLNSPLRQISYKQFINLTHEFKRQCEDQFGAPCTMSIRFMSQKPFRSTFFDDLDRDGSFQAEMEQKLVIYEADNFRDATSDLFNVASYTEVRIHPADKEKAPPSAFATLEFEGNRAKAYVQGNSRPLSLSLAS